MGIQLDLMAQLFGKPEPPRHVAGTPFTPEQELQVLEAWREDQLRLRHDIEPNQLKPKTQTKMKATRITYSRLVNKGNYENCKIEIELEAQDGERAADVFNAAKKFVDERCRVETVSQYSIDNAKNVLADTMSHTGRAVAEAQSLLDSINVKDDLPF